MKGKEKMTLEEGKALAEQGDINAMCTLGDFFSKQNTGESMVEAAKWYEMAAKKMYYMLLIGLP